MDIPSRNTVKLDNWRLKLMSRKVYEFNEYRLVLGERLLYLGNEKLCKLPPTPYYLLRFFVENPMKNLSNKELIIGVWGAYEKHDETNLHNLIHRLRKQFGSNSHDFIHNRGEGYVFNVPVRETFDDFPVVDGFENTGLSEITKRESAEMVLSDNERTIQSTPEEKSTRHLRITTPENNLVEDQNTNPSGEWEKLPKDSIHKTDEIEIHNTIEQEIRSELNNSEASDEKLSINGLKIWFAEKHKLVSVFAAIGILGLALIWNFSNSFNFPEPPPSNQFDSTTFVKTIEANKYDLSADKIIILSSTVNVDFSEWSTKQDKVTIKYTYKIKKLTDNPYFTLKLGTQSATTPQIQNLTPNFHSWVKPLSSTEGMCNPKIKYAWERFIDISSKEKNDVFDISFENIIYGSHPNLDEQYYDRYMYNQFDELVINITFPETNLPEENEIDISKAYACNKDKLSKIKKNTDNYKYDRSSRTFTFIVKQTRTDEFYSVKWKRQKNQ